MGLLEFDRNRVLAALEHSKRSEKWNMCYGEEGTDAPGLLFVKDEGIYLMTNASSEDFSDIEKHIVYAEGFSPKDDDVWERSRYEVGGDDFAVFLDADFVEDGIAKSVKAHDRDPHANPKGVISLGVTDVIEFEPTS